MILFCNKIVHYTFSMLSLDCLFWAESEKHTRSRPYAWEGRGSLFLKSSSRQFILVSVLIYPRAGGCFG